MKRLIFLGVSGAAVLLVFIGSGCIRQWGSETEKLDNWLATVIKAQSITGDPSIGRTVAEIDSPLAQLGMKLFFSKSLSVGRDTACVSCHHPFLGGGDALPLPIGVEAVNADILGKGRAHPGAVFTVPRNSPTTFNSVLWKRALFFDGRVEILEKQDSQLEGATLAIRTPDSDFGVADPQAGQSLLEAQARFPVTSVDEMRGRIPKVIVDIRKDREAVRRLLVERLDGKDEDGTAKWLKEFSRAFPEQDRKTLIRYENIAKAISAYEQSQLFVKNPWRAYVQGDKAALGPSAKRGALLFYQGTDEGGGGCGACHSGDFFSDEKYHVLCIPQVGVGKGDGETGTDDFGRFRETGDSADMHAFRTPSLLNVEVTGPYGHTGFYETLEEVVRHHFSPGQALASRDFSDLDPMIPRKGAEKNTKDVLAHLEKNRELGIPAIPEISLSDEQVVDILNFIKSLTDPCVKDRECLRPWIPDSDTLDPDGFLLRAIDSTGRPL